MKNFNELFDACNMRIEDDGSLTDPEPIKIVLSVAPRSIDFVTGKVDFMVLIDPSLESREEGSVTYTEYDVDLEIPLIAVNLAPDAAEAAERIASLTEKNQAWAKEHAAVCAERDDYKQKYIRALPSSDD